MKIANGIKIDNEDYILASAVSATYDGNGNEISKILPTKPTFDENKEYMLLYTSNAEKTDYQLTWKEYKENTNIDADDLEY